MDKTRVCQAFSRAAVSYDAIARFQRFICERMLCLLPEWLPSGFKPLEMLDAGCGTGFGSQSLKCLWPDAGLTGCDISADMIDCMHKKGFSAIKGDLENMSFDAHCFDFIWSSLALQWCRPEIVFPELFRVLDHRGILFFSTLAPGTLAEIDFAFSGIDDSRRTLPFQSPENLKAHLETARFTGIELMAEKQIMYYPDFRSVIESIRGVGAGSGGKKRQTMMGKQAWKKVQDRYESLRNEAGLPVTYEMVYGFATAGE